MARLSLKNGLFSQCVEYCDKAIERLCDRNEHPADTEAFYLKGVALQYLGEYEKAYDILYRAAWNYPHRSAALFELAAIDCRNGEYEEALKKCEESLGLNKGHLKAQNLITAIKRKLGRADAETDARAAVKDDRLDLFALVEYSHFADVNAKIAAFSEKPENLLDVVRDYMKAGLLEDALYTLSFAKEGSPLIGYYKAYLLKDPSLIEKAENTEMGYCFPSSLEDIAVLSYAIENGKTAANANYYLGCLYYDRCRYDEAAACFESCLRQNPEHGRAWRNLSLYWFDKTHNAEKALYSMENALKYRPHDPRLLLEYEQLLKNTNADIEKRLAVYEQYPELLKERDDCYLDKITLLSMQGRYEEAIKMAAVKHFHIYEGGEGKLTKMHALMHVLYGNELANSGEREKAEQIYKNGINMPRSYGEAKTFFNKEAHIYYYLSKLYEGERKKAALEKAAEYKAAVSEISLFRALALKELGRKDEAQSVLSEMLSVAQNLIDNKDLRTYYGVGSPSPMPFELDIEKQNLLSGYTLKAFALYGMEQYSEAKVCITKAAALDPNDFSVYTFKTITMK